MSSTGFSGFDQLGSVDSTDMEQLQLSFSAQFDGIQSSNGHTLQNTSVAKSEPKFKMKNESASAASKSAGNVFGWPTKKSKYEDDQHQRMTSMWSNLPGAPAYSLDDYQVESLRYQHFR